MNKRIPNRCPKCGQHTVRKDLRQCINPSCNMALYFPGDEPLKTGVLFFQWLDKGPRGTGWYRRASIQLMFS